MFMLIAIILTIVTVPVQHFLLPHNELFGVLTIFIAHIAAASVIFKLMDKADDNLRAIKKEIARGPSESG